ncbi:MAG: zinc ABC transporter substrate-binding protein, partial [Candidatus Magasanikbacteria bacterium CG10_big_fil_rev_8_21_14_0_10_43_6]
EHGEFNPHYWLSPANAIAMVQSIEEELSALDPTNATAYKQNAQNYIAELRAKDTQWKTSITSLDNKNIVTFHDAFGYFAEHFGLSVLATFEEFPGKEPTPQYLARLQEDVKEHNVKTMYLEPQLAVGAIKSFAKDQNVELGILDPLGGVDGRNSYIELIDYNVQTIVSTNK